MSHHGRSGPWASGSGATLDGRQCDGHHQHRSCPDPTRVRAVCGKTRNAPNTPGMRSSANECGTRQDWGA